VHGARHNQLIRPMLEGSIGIAQRQGVSTVAEGVDTAHDWALLRKIGCDVAQGYCIGRPLAGELLSVWCTDWQARRPRLMASTSTPSSPPTNQPTNRPARHETRDERGPGAGAGL
jgi:predicted signal transduction protein with EAL and GGDEF domain